MGRYLKYTVLMLLCAAQSCILEDRENCPTYLSIDFSDTPDEVESICLILRHESGWMFRDTVHGSESGSIYEIPVKKGLMTVAVFGNVRQMEYNEGYSVTTGNEADSLYTCFFTAEYTGELSSDTISVRKDFIGLHLKIMGRENTAGKVSVAVESSSVGYDLNGNVIRGTYRHTPELIESPDSISGHYQYVSRITRQGDDSLLLRITVQEEGRKAEELSVNLHEYLSGLELESEDDGLRDLYLTVDLSRSTMTVSPIGWEYTDKIEIEI